MHATKAPEFLKYPVVLTPRAWQEAVHLERSPDAAAISQRLGDVIWTLYRELHMRPDCTSFYFGLYRLLPSGESFDRYWLDLKFNCIKTPAGACYLYVSLKEETHTPCA